MILNDKGEIKVSGKQTEVMADLAVIIHSLYEDRLLTKEDIEKVFKFGFMSEDEIDKEKEKMKKIEKELLGGSNYDF